MASRGGPELRDHGRLGVIWRVPGPHYNHQTVWTIFSTCKIQHQPCRNKGIRKSQDANYENTKNKAAICSRYNRGTSIQDRRNLRSLVAPLPRDGGFYLWQSRSPFSPTTFQESIKDKLFQIEWERRDIRLKLGWLCGGVGNARPNPRGCMQVEGKIN